MLMKYETGYQHDDRSEVVLAAEPAAIRFDQAACANDARYIESERFQRRMRRQRRAEARAYRAGHGWQVKLW